MQITVSSSPVPIGQGNLTLQNHGPDDLWIGGADVSPSTGILVASGMGQDFPDGSLPRMYAVSEGTSDVRTLEL